MAGPPMVQALEELVAAAKLGPADPFKYDPTTARAAFWRGECGMALAWPTAANEAREERGAGSGEKRNVSIPSKVDSRIRVGFVELPGSPRVFNLTGRVWDDRAEDENPCVPLLAIAGRIGVVNVKSDRAEAAFQLLLWLSDSRMSPQTAPPARPRRSSASRT